MTSETTQERKLRRTLTKLVLIFYLVLSTAAIIAFADYTKPSMTLSAEPIVVEAGTEISERSYVESLWYAGWEDVSVSHNVDQTTPGTYLIEYVLDRITYPLTVAVTDTIAPELVLNDGPYSYVENDTIPLSDFVRSASDVTPVTVNFATDLSGLAHPGTYTVTIRCTDTSGNSTEKEASVEITPLDPESPVLTAPESITITQDGEYDLLSYVSASDNMDESPSISVDDSALDPSTVGFYAIRYTAKDWYGNETSAECQVEVLPKDVTPPTLTNLGTAYVYLNDSFDPYAGLIVTDDYDPNPTIVADTSAVVLSKLGWYPVTYTVTDSAGNSAVYSRYVAVIRRSVWYTPPGGSYGWDATGIDGQPYLVCVNRAMCTVTVYTKDSNDAYTVPIKAMACSVGRAGCETPAGRYTTSGRDEWHLMIDYSWGRYAIRIYGGIMFHSVCYYTPSVDNLEFYEYNKLGSAASLGCIRLSVADELWLYQNCPYGFQVIIYDDVTTPGPLGKPSSITIDVNDSRRGWDPTDPAWNNPWRS